MLIRYIEELNINHVSSFEPNGNAIKNLVMDDKHRKLIEVLTYKYQDTERDRKEAWNADFIRSKGEGQIFLLHGPPGVGKTYTAECIAEITRKFLPAGNARTNTVGCPYIFGRTTTTRLDLRRHR